VLFLAKPVFFRFSSPNVASQRTAAQGVAAQRSSFALGW
jgi:hypothetical protein